MARSSSTWKPGIPSPNPTGKMTLSERVAARTIAEAFRELADPVDIGRSLLALYSGIDPFALKPEGAQEPGMPVPGAVPIDMTHRMAALKMYLEYGYGKPLQGVVIDAQVRQQTTLREERHTVVELRELSRSSPEAREALRTIARVVLGQRPLEVDARNAQPVGGSANTFPRPAIEAGAEPSALAEDALVGEADERDDVSLGPVSPEGLDEEEVETPEFQTTGQNVGEDVGELHADMVAELDAAVNGKEKKTVRLPGDVL